VGKGALFARRAHHLSMIIKERGHAPLCPPYETGNNRIVSSVILRCEWRDAMHRAGSLEGCTAPMQPGRRPSRLAEEASTSG